MERLQELKKEVAAQEFKLKSLQQQQQQLHHQQLQQQQTSSTFGSTNKNGDVEQEAMNSLIFLKEKELALALMKVAELTGQLEHLKKSEFNRPDSPSVQVGKSPSDLFESPGLKIPVVVQSTGCALNTKPVFSAAPANRVSNDSHTTESSVVYYGAQLLPSSSSIISDKLKQSTSFDNSLARARQKNTERDKFFASSFSGDTQPSPQSQPTFPSKSFIDSTSPVARSTNNFVSSSVKSSPETEASKLGFGSDSTSERSQISSSPVHRRSTAGSIMSRFAPTPYSSRSISVDCGMFRRPLGRTLITSPHDDSFDSSAAINSEILVSLSVSSDNESPNKKVCTLLPKSASFHYGHSRESYEKSQVKAANLKLNIKESPPITNLNRNVSLSGISTNVKFQKPKINPKPAYLLREYKSLSPADRVWQNNLSSSSSSQVTCSSSSVSTNKPVCTLSSTQEFLKNQSSFHSKESDNVCIPVCMRNNLTITLYHSVKDQISSAGVSNMERHPASTATEVPNKPDKPLPNGPEVFKKGCVKELSKLFSYQTNNSKLSKTLVSQSKKDEIIIANVKENQNDNKENNSSTSSHFDIENVVRSEIPFTSVNDSCGLVSSICSQVSCVPSTCIISESKVAPAIDISANAVSSALSILLSSSQSSHHHHTSASRPNRLFGYSPPFARPKFSLVPSSPPSSTSMMEKDILTETYRKSQDEQVSHGPQTLYSLFSPPPKTKLSVFSTTESSPGSPDRQVRKNESKGSEQKIGKNNIYLPPLSYITLSSDLSLSDGERKMSSSSSSYSSSSLKRTKRKKRVTIDPNFLFLNAAVEGELDIIRTIISMIASPNQASENGMTALHMGVCNNHYDVVKFLLDFGCDVNASNNENWTPLHYAALGNKKEMIELLVMNGASVFALTSSDQQTPLQKCQPQNPHYEDCRKVLADFGRQLGISNKGIVYSTAEYDAESSDEFSLKDGEMVKILRKGGDGEESEWWWAAKCEEDCGARSEGYVPRSILALHPRRTKLYTEK